MTVGPTSLTSIVRSLVIGLVLTPLLAVGTTLAALLELLVALLAPCGLCARRARTRDPKCVLITGASSGLGRALAVKYARAGRTLLLTGRNAAGLAETVAECKARGCAEIKSRANVDLGDAAGRDALAAWIRECDRSDATRIDLVVANAGVDESTCGGEAANIEVRKAGLPGAALEDATRRIFATNVDGVFSTIFPALEGMRARGAGQVAIMASLAAFHPLNGSQAYSASKAAVKAFGEGLRWQLMREGVSVNVICPGYVSTNLTKSNGFGKGAMSVDAAARIIVAGLANDEAVISFPSTSFWAVWLGSAFEPVLRDCIARNRVFGGAMGYAQKRKASKKE